MFANRYTKNESNLLTYWWNHSHYLRLPIDLLQSWYLSIMCVCVPVVPKPNEWMQFQLKSNNIDHRRDYEYIFRGESTNNCVNYIKWVKRFNRDGKDSTYLNIECQKEEANETFTTHTNTHTHTKLPRSKRERTRFQLTLSRSFTMLIK